ncbi:MAG: biotin/lipoate--protein ligase family protein [Candidatus Eiseniibacteriota bacterium]
MALDQRSRIREPHARSLDLPPPFRLVALREVGDAFAHAVANAGALGAGTVVFVGRFDLAEFAVVLEPDEPLAASRRGFYAGMAALGDALAALAPPEKPIAIDWPDAFRIDGGLVGGGRLGWPAEARETARPDWLVFGASIRTTSMSGEEAGLHPLSTALEEEGFGDASAARLVESFARHLMVAIDRWQETGFESVAREYLSRVTLERGARAAIDARGDLEILRPGRPVTRRKLAPALKAPSWLDPTSGGPRW